MADYGWGKGKERPVYPCTGTPQGILRHKNRSTGYASTAGKMAAAFALGAQLFAKRDGAFAHTLRRKAPSAYALGIKYPGVCQTAPGTSPYFYEEDNWVDEVVSIFQCRSLRDRQSGTTLSTAQWRHAISRDGAGGHRLDIWHEPVGHVDGDWCERLTGIHLEHAAAFAEFNTGFIVYHDDLGDYATNEHIMDGTANLALMLSALDDRRKR